MEVRLMPMLSAYFMNLCGKRPPTEAALLFAGLSIVRIFGLVRIPRDLSQPFFSLVMLRIVGLGTVLLGSLAEIVGRKNTLGPYAQAPVHSCIPAPTSLCLS
jgi:hypothetical protein